MILHALVIAAASQLGSPGPDLRLDMPATERYVVCTSDYVRTRLREAQTPELLAASARKHCRALLEPAIAAMTDWTLRHGGEPGKVSLEFHAEARVKSERYFTATYPKILIRNAAVAREW